jgi:hypothetical protein
VGHHRRRSSGPTLIAAITVLLGWLSFPGIRCIEAANKTKVWEPRAIDIRVQAGGFGRASPADIKAVLQSAAGEISRYCPNTRLPSIDVYRRSDHPQTDLRRSDEGRIVIGLAARDNHWAQYAFQFAHEYCHALINYRNNREQLPPHAQRPNLWLEESLCETASLFTLRALGHSWLVAPPYPVWREYAPWFPAYARERLLLPKHRLPAGRPFIVWFRANEASLRRDGMNRDRNIIIAAQLLPIFEKEPQGWGAALAFFNSASNQSLTQQFTDWRSRCPRELQGFVAKLAAVFEVKA